MCVDGSFVEATTGAIVPRRWRGQSMIEFALIVPLILALVFSIVELGIVVTSYVGLTNSAREAARAGTAYQYNPSTPPDQTPAVTVPDGERKQAMDNAWKATLPSFMDVGNMTASYNYDPATPSNNYRYGDKVVVSLSYQYAYFFN